MVNNHVSPHGLGNAAEVERWESAFQTYADAAHAEYGSDFARRAVATAEAARQVARAWREIADQAGSAPRWLPVALNTAADAYEDLATAFAEHVLVINES